MTETNLMRLRAARSRYGDAENAAFERFMDGVHNGTIGPDDLPGDTDIDREMRLIISEIQRQKPRPAKKEDVPVSLS